MMATRSLIKIRDNKKTLTTIYRQYDGYPTGMGLDIRKLFKDKIDIINGYCNETHPNAFNGMGDLACFIIKNLKKDIGNVYLYPANVSDVGERFIYTIYEKNNTLYLRIFDVYAEKIMFNDVLTEFNQTIAERLENEAS